MSELTYAPVLGSIYTQIDTAQQAPLGTRYTFPLNPAAAIGSTPYAGLGSPLTVAYVQYFSTAASNFIAAPGVLYWTDKSYTVVSGLDTDGSATINFAAGWMPLNTTSTGKTGAALLTAMKGNYFWMVVGGYLAGCTSAASVAAGEYLIGSGTAFTPARVTSGGAPTSPTFGQAATAVSSGLSDVNVIPYGTFNF